MTSLAVISYFSILLKFTLVYSCLFCPGHFNNALCTVDNSMLG